MKNLLKTILLIFVLSSCSRTYDCFLVETETTVVYKKDIVNPGTYPDKAEVTRKSYTKCALARIEEKEILQLAGVETRNEVDKCTTTLTVVTRK